MFGSFSHFLSTGLAVADVQQQQLYTRVILQLVAISVTRMLLSSVL